jgi:hypothetical protein
MQPPSKGRSASKSAFAGKLIRNRQSTAALVNRHSTGARPMAAVLGASAQIGGAASFAAPRDDGD